MRTPPGRTALFHAKDCNVSEIASARAESPFARLSALPSKYRRLRMGYGISLFFLAVGAVLTWGVTDTSPGIDLAAVGVILMLVGLIGLALTLAFWSSFSPFAGSTPFRRT